MREENPDVEIGLRAANLKNAEAKKGGAVAVGVTEILGEEVGW